MGCNTSFNDNEINEELKHATPDFDEEADPERTSYCKSDFTQTFNPGEFAQLFLKDRPLERIKDPPKREPNNSDDESSDDYYCKELKYKEFKITFNEFEWDMMQQYSFLTKNDVCAAYNYLNYRASWKLKHPEELLQSSISITDYIKFGYIFYHFNEILYDPILLLYYYADDQFNRHSSVRALRKFTSQHFNIAIDELRTVICPINQKSSHISQEIYLQQISELKKRDPLEKIFRFREVPIFDVELQLLSKEDLEFSDISTRNHLKAKFNEIKDKAIKEGWDEQKLHDELEKAEKDDENAGKTEIFENKKNCAISELSQ